MAIAVEKFLREKGFRANANPFQWTNAEQERRDLASYFVKVPWFDQLFGDPLNPESLILFAPQGYGKSSHRLQIEQMANNNKPPPLVVSFTSFDLLFANAQAVDTSEHYLALIQQTTLDQLMKRLQRNRRHAVQIAQNPHIEAQLHGLLLNAAPLIAYEHGIYETPLLAPFVQQLRAKRFSLKEGLLLLTTIIRAADFASVYFLIDGVDETPYTRRDPLLAATLLSPLLDAPGVLQECGFAFKFFLPADLEPVMREHNIGRLDRIPVHLLRWSESDLLLMLQLRLESYSRESPQSPPTVHTFQELCEPHLRSVDQRLVQAAQGSPRCLIDLARDIVTTHCQNATSIDSLITAQTVEQVLARTPQEPVQPSSVVKSPSAPVLQHLYFDQRGVVWLNDQPHSELTGLERRCMEFLWQNRNRTITRDELIEALYSDTSDRGDPQNSMYKIVRQLQKKLCVGEADEHTYIRGQRGVGYVLCNYRDTPPEGA